jgi:hypothetical protein
VDVFLLNSQIWFIFFDPILMLAPISMLFYDTLFFCHSSATEPYSELLLYQVLTNIIY